MPTKARFSRHLVQSPAHQCRDSVWDASLMLCLPSQDSASAASHPQGSHSALSAPESALRALGLASSAGQHPANSLAGPAQTETNSSSLAEVGGRAEPCCRPAALQLTHLPAGNICSCVRSVATPTDADPVAGLQQRDSPACWLHTLMCQICRNACCCKAVARLRVTLNLKVFAGGECQHVQAQSQQDPKRGLQGALAEQAAPHELQGHLHQHLLCLRAAC